MSLPIQPAPYSSGPRYSRPRGPSVWSLIRQRGAHGMVVAVAAMSLGLSPVLLLAWWNWWRLSPVPIAPGVKVQVKSAQLTRDAEAEKPGETALLYVVCQVARAGQWRDLLQWEDEARRRSDESNPPEVRHELVYIRPAKKDHWPFALLGAPPLSAWLPVGQYEVLVVYSASRGFFNSDSRKPSPFPLATEHAAAELPAGRRTVVRVPLPHHEQCLDNTLDVQLGEAAAAAGQVPGVELAALLTAIERVKPIPTPGGVLLDLPEPAIHHQEPHRDCRQDLRDLADCRREWTLRQVQTLHDWLPAEAAAARQRLEEIERSLGWRDFFRGWYWYTAAGISGLVFARWATIAKLERFRARQELIESLKLLAGIFFLAIIVWIVLSALSDGGGPRVFRFR